VSAEVARRDLTGFFDQTYRSSNVFDYGVAEVTRTTAVVRRYGEAIFPVDVRITFADGEQVTERWAGDSRWHSFSYDGRSTPIKSVEVDPNRVLLLDVNYTNNSWTSRPAAATAATRWSAAWMIWLEDCLLSWAALV
jgi:hypothetical protein